MKRMSIIFLLFMNIQAEEAQEHPYAFNVEQIMRTHSAYPNGSTNGDVENAILQAATRVREEEAKRSWKVWIQEYHAWVPYAACVVVGGVLGYVMRGVK